MAYMKEPEEELEQSEVKQYEVEQSVEQSEGERSEGERSEGERSEGEQSQGEQSEGKQCGSEGDQSEAEQSEDWPIEVGAVGLSLHTELQPVRRVMAHQQTVENRPYRPEPPATRPVETDLSLRE
ncbi:hypothetical protein PtA15_3A494 [Puccinia triticina]|uniref:Uncharacterized protein n=1 Tax=Puccinia triticina TaxID=208348 RepID=A0ABY7CJZ3_9BASI|nr:uncharacterized protein PtA15_3A494 [Puccinia triticina]WAQ83127.1 hypothetical protein PtA15_3A494 [Puccinia triticina]